MQPPDDPHARATTTQEATKTDEPIPDTIPNPPPSRDHLRQIIFANPTRDGRRTEKRA
jgi:hypothetical protein